MSKRRDRICPLLTYDAGWVGRGIHGLRGGETKMEYASIEIVEAPDRPLLYYEQDGVHYIMWRKDHVGFVRP